METDRKEGRILPKIKYKQERHTKFIPKLHIKKTATLLTL